MPNHIHLLIQPIVPLAQITNGIKGVTAKSANAILGRTGEAFWQDESFDHWIRSAESFERIRTYIESNPVKARLVERSEDWKWSSANASFASELSNAGQTRTARSVCATKTTQP